MIFSISLSTIIITLLIIIINMRTNDPFEKWDIIEYIVAVIFGWISIVYIFIKYSHILFKK